MAGMTGAGDGAADDVDRQPLGEFLARLAARLPAPGAGATAAVEAALAASLVAMVGRFTTAPEHAEVVGRCVAAADALRADCLEAAEADEVAFSAVAEAMAMPRDTDEQQQARTSALAAAQLGAAQPPRRVIESAAELVGLAEQLLPVAKRTLVSDVAAVTAAARAAATTARLAVETNLGGIEDDAAVRELTATVAGVDRLLARADAVEVAVRDRVRG
jgi:formiminotetrahydrofolate cyclodeaminase